MAVIEIKKNYYQIYGRYTDFNGKPKRYKKTIGKMKNKKEAQKYDRAYRESLMESISTMTFDELVEQYTIRSHTMNIKESTLVGDEGYYRNHLKEYFGNKDIKEITPNTIEIWKVEMMKKRKPSGEHYSAATLNHAKNVLSKYLSYAERMQLINYNPCSKVTKFSNPNEIKKDDSLKFWEVDEFNTFMEYVDDPYWIDVFTFMFQTGLRQGEMFALQWNDIDFKKQKISVTKTVTYKTKQSGYAITPPKTSNSIRKVDMTEDVYNILKERFASQKKKDGFTMKYFVFGDIKPLSRRKLSDNLDKYISLANVSRITPHGFRHSHASVLIHAGIDDSLIANRLGHTVSELRKTYVHIYDDMKEDMKSKLKLIFAK